MRNLFAVTFGLLIQKQRLNRGVSSSLLAERLAIGESTLRLFEVGKSIIPIDRIVRLKGMFEEYKFEKLCKLFTVLSYLQNSTTIEIIKKKVAELSAIDSEIKEIASKFSSHFHEMKESNSLKSYSELIFKNGLDDELHHFLISETNPIGNRVQVNVFEGNIISRFENLPSYDLDDVVDYITNRAQKRLQITTDTIINWEKDHINDISEIYGITQRYNAVSSMENIELFDYSYLFHGTKMKVIYLDIEMSSSEIIRKQFLDNINSVFKKRKLLNHKNDRFTKIDVDFKRGLNKTDELFKLMKSNVGKEVTSFTNFWAYKMKESGHFVGFLTNDQGNYSSYLGVSPSKPEVKVKIDTFMNIWNTL